MDRRGSEASDSEEYGLEGVKPPTKEIMDRVKSILEGYGHKVIY